MTRGQFDMAAHSDNHDFFRGNKVVDAGIRRHDVGGLERRLVRSQS
jgi:hypothetical protein